MLDLQRLATLRQFALRGTVAATARSLSLTPSAVSQQLALLSKQAGVPLVRKRGRNLVLTAAGESLVGYAGRVLDLLEEAQTALDTMGTAIRGTVRLAAIQSAALALLPRALSLLAEGYPSLRVEAVQFEPGQALVATYARDFDLVLAEEYPGQSRPRLAGLAREELTTDTLELAVGRRGPYSGLRRLAESAGAAWVLEPAGTIARDFAVQACRAAGFEPDVRFETADLQTHLRLIESGNAVGLVPGLMRRSSQADVRYAPLPGRPRRTLFTACRSASAGSPALRAVREALAVSAG
jgi:DNA-binding transcriptional LysR family regulator